MNHSTIQAASQGLGGVIGRASNTTGAQQHEKCALRFPELSPEPQQPVVGRELDRLHTAISELSACLGDHRMRLSSVLLSSPPSAEATKGAAIEDLGVIGGSIRQATLLIEAMHADLNELRYRLTI